MLVVVVAQTGIGQVCLLMVELAAEAVVVVP
jgi:hypothetical protein